MKALALFLLATTATAEVATFAYVGEFDDPVEPVAIEGSIEFTLPVTGFPNLGTLDDPIWTLIEFEAGEDGDPDEETWLVSSHYLIQPVGRADCVIFFARLQYIEIEGDEVEEDDPWRGYIANYCQGTGVGMVMDTDISDPDRGVRVTVE